VNSLGSTHRGRVCVYPPLTLATRARRRVSVRASMTDLHDGNPIFMECAICFGSKQRSRRSPGARICKNDGCKGELCRRRADGEDVAAHATLKEDAPEQMSCYTVKEVIGVSLCRVSSMNSRDKRAGRKRVHEDMCFAVRGGFGEDKDDAFIPNTRWVLLSELVKNVDKRELAALSKFAKALPERLKSAQQYLEEQRESDDE